MGTLSRRHLIVSPTDGVGRLFPTLEAIGSSMSEQRAAHKDNHTAGFVPSTPGLALVADAAAMYRSGRPGWKIGGLPDSGEPLVVPEGILSMRQGSGVDFFAVKESPETFLPTRLAVALRTREPTAQGVYESLTEQDRVAGRRLYAAALRDIAGLDDDAIATAGGHECSNADRAARRDYEAGREFWNRLGGWPWLYFQGGKPPDNWWTTSADQRLAKAYTAWRSGRL
jgi:hypothetical protein